MKAAFFMDAAFLFSKECLLKTAADFE